MLFAFYLDKREEEEEEKKTYFFFLLRFIVFITDWSIVYVLEEKKKNTGAFCVSDEDY